MLNALSQQILFTKPLTPAIIAAATSLEDLLVNDAGEVETFHMMDAIVETLIDAGIGDRFDRRETPSPDETKIWVDTSTRPSEIKRYDRASDAWIPAEFSDVWANTVVRRPITDFGEWGSAVSSTVNAQTFRDAIINGGLLYIPAGDVPCANMRGILTRSVDILADPNSLIVMDEIDGDGLEFVISQAGYTEDRIINVHINGLRVDMSAMKNPLLSVPGVGDYPPLNRGTSPQSDGVQILGGVDLGGGTVVDGLTNVIFENSYIYAADHWLLAGGDSGAFIQGGKNITARNNTFVGIRDDSIYARPVLGGDPSGSRLDVHGNTYINCWFGCAVKDSFDNVTIRDEQGFGTVFVTGILNLSTASKNITIDNIRSKGAWQTVRVDGAQNGSVNRVLSEDAGYLFEADYIAEYNIRAAAAGLALMATSLKPLTLFTDKAHCGVSVQGSLSFLISQVNTRNRSEYDGECVSVLLEDYVTPTGGQALNTRALKVSDIDGPNTLLHIVDDQTSNTNSLVGHVYSNLRKAGRIVVPNGMKSGSTYNASFRLFDHPNLPSATGLTDVVFATLTLDADQCMGGMQIITEAWGKKFGTAGTHSLGLTLNGTEVNSANFPADQNGNLYFESKISSYRIDEQRIGGTGTTEGDAVANLDANTAIDLSAGATIEIIGNTAALNDRLDLNWVQVDVVYGSPRA